MFKLTFVLALAIASTMAAPKAAILTPAFAPAVVTSQSSQFIARNYNTLATPLVAAPFVAAAPLIKAAPIITAEPILKSAPIVAANPLAEATPVIANVRAAPVAVENVAYASPLAYSSPLLAQPQQVVYNAPLVAQQRALAYSAPFLNSAYTAYNPYYQSYVNSPYVQSPIYY